VIKPDILLNMDIEATFWLDVGTKGTYPLNPVDGGSDPLVLPLSTGVTQPDYADPSTWRDRALEACIVTAVERCFSVRSLKAAVKRRQIVRRKVAGGEPKKPVEESRFV
jgi:hypothetical protein